MTKGESTQSFKQSQVRLTARFGGHLDGQSLNQEQSEGSARGESCDQNNTFCLKLLTGIPLGKVRSSPQLD